MQIMIGSASMSLVLKNNRALLKRHKSNTSSKRKYSGGYSTEKTEVNLPKASPQLLREIKKKMIQERQSRNKKIVIVYISVLVTCISLLLYLQ